MPCRPYIQDIDIVAVDNFLCGFRRALSSKRPLRFLRDTGPDLRKQRYTPRLLLPHHHQVCAVGRREGAMPGAVLRLEREYFGRHLWTEVTLHKGLGTLDVVHAIEESFTVPWRIIEARMLLFQLYKLLLCWCCGSNGIMALVAEKDMGKGEARFDIIIRLILLVVLADIFSVTSPVDSAKPRAM